MKLLLVSVCLAFALAGGHQQFGCSFDDNLLISKVTSTKARSYDPGNSFNWGSREAVVPYFFAEGIQESDKDVFRKEMQRITDHVPCITFNEKHQVEVPHHHLEIQLGNEWGCQVKKVWNYRMQQYDIYHNARFLGSVGPRGYFGQKLVLYSTYRLSDTDWCAEHQFIKGSVLHELMHALGIMHTQKRFDSDKHIEYNEDCVEPAKKSQYEKSEKGLLKDYDVPYKCNSIMHYKNTTFSIDRKNCPTMYAKSASCKHTGMGGDEAIEEDWQLLREAHCKR